MPFAEDGCTLSDEERRRIMDLFRPAEDCNTELERLRRQMDEVEALAKGGSARVQR